MSRILVVMGTRPEAIKMAPVVHALRALPHMEPMICATAQHRHMLDQVLRIFGLRPDVDMDIMREGQTLTFVTTEVLRRVTDLLRELKPAAVLVEGDTTTSMAAALAAFFEKIPVGHVEAGLRTGHRYDPFPEEMMRKQLTQLTSFHFAPTRLASRTLWNEGVSPHDIYLTGNSVVDAVLWIRERTRADHDGLPRIAPGRRMILVTAHRRESFGAPLLGICRAITELVERNADIEVVYPVHPNPNVTGPVHQHLGQRERIHLIPPLEYDRFIGLMDRAYIVMSDSGGIQEEAPVLAKPVLVMRKTTERVEAIQANAAILVGTDPERILREAERLLRDEAAYSSMARSRSPFGDGHAAERMAAILSQEIDGAGRGADEARYVPD